MRGRYAEALSQLGKYFKYGIKQKFTSLSSINPQFFFYIFKTYNYYNKLPSFLCKNLFLNVVPFLDYLLFMQLLVLMHLWLPVLLRPLFNITKRRYFLVIISPSKNFDGMDNDASEIIMY